MSEREQPGASVMAEAPRSVRAVAAERRAGLRLRLGELWGRATAGPLELQMLGRVLLHAALVGLAAGGLGTLFVFLSELAAVLLLGHLAGYHPAHAAGEHDLFPVRTAFRPAVLFVLPGLGALASGVIATRFAPEAMGGGTDVVISAYHDARGFLRRRVAFVKLLTSVLTLGTGGSGGREGPTMLMGGAVGSWVGTLLKVSDRERRILLVAGTAAGMAAVFRTPLGAALLAVEVLHRDDFESDALVPAVLSSVVGYSVAIAFFGQAPLFAHAEHFPFVPAHLPIYALLALFVCLGAIVFLAMMRFVKGLSERSRIPKWARPAAGGLALGMMTVPILLTFESFSGRHGQGVGLLTGGYGAIQLAISGSPRLPGGWQAVEWLTLFAFVKMAATSLTVATGGSAGDFGPSLVIGGVLGGAFGRAAALVTGDPRIDPGAFVLVGMATFYGGIAHVPLAALVMTCELAGSYELLVPLMLCEGIAYIVLKKHALYSKQVPTKRDSPAHRHQMLIDVLQDVPVASVVVPHADAVQFTRQATARAVVQAVAASAWQDTFPVVDDQGAIVGLINADVLRIAMSHPEFIDVAVADDLMGPAVAVRMDEDLHAALQRMLQAALRELPVLDARGAVVGFLDEADITRAYHDQVSSASTHA